MFHPAQVWCLIQTQDAMAPNPTGMRSPGGKSLHTGAFQVNKLVQRNTGEQFHHASGVMGTGKVFRKYSLV